MTKPANTPRQTLLRPRNQPGGAKVTNIELFFDLVFVYAVTQLSHHLLADPTLVGAGQTALLLMAVWTIWIDTAWITNWLDPDRAPVRLLLLALMLAGLLLAATLPDAFTTSGLAFAATVAAMQIGRTLFMMAALHGKSPANERNFRRIIVWFTAAAILWLIGGLLPATARVIAWLAAVAIDYIGPAAGFAVPGLGRSNPADWDVAGGHMAERCAGFVIIALGESIVVTGTSFATAAWTADTLAAFAIAFISCATLWWIYFDTGAERGSERISEAEEPGALARIAYTYLHLPIVAGIIIAAVGDDILLAEPHTPSNVATSAILIGGAALYVAGNLCFKNIIASRPPLSHMIGLALLACLTSFVTSFTVIELAACVMGILIITAGWETVALRRK